MVAPDGTVDTEEFPTCVGMNLKAALNGNMKARVPHMRGDEPKALGIQTVLDESSPHAWG